MIALSTAEIAEITEGRLLGDPTVMVTGSVETDSREVGPGSLFIAMPGESTDGHLFASAAVDAGAAAVLAERELSLEVPVILVPDGVRALADLAREVVSRVRARGDLRVVAVTGSNGKTTTKNMLRAILAAEGSTVAPPGSFNNHVGAPHSMLRVDESTRFLVVEMGASAEGEIARLVSIVTPDIGIVLKVGMAHAGGFGGIEATERAKAELVRDLPSSAVAVLNADDPRVSGMAAITAARIRRFGHVAASDVRAEAVRMGMDGTEFTAVVDGEAHPVRLRILGEHHVYNALAALTAAVELGIAPERAIAAIESLDRAERWRMERLETETGITVINDAYNASPDSTAAALRSLAQLADETGRRSVAVLGEMAELGDFAAEEHDRIGRLVVRLNIRKLYVIGHAARHLHMAAGLEGSWDGESVLLADQDEAYDRLRDELQAGDLVLVKSSKSAGLRFLGDRIAGVAS